MENTVKARTPGEDKQTGMDHNVVAVDYETYYKKGEYSLSNMTVWEYCHDRRFDAYLISIYGPEVAKDVILRSTEDYTDLIEK
jgi:hypothetical protein